MGSIQLIREQIDGTKFDVGIKGVLTSLIKQLEWEPLKQSAGVTWDPYPPEKLNPKDKLSQDYLWEVCGPLKQFLRFHADEGQALSKLFRPGDIVVGETGTSGQFRHPACEKAWLIGSV